jgi:ElaB/YqjD/DUF883 family membrane-anchored ribosome-binding protein
MINSDPGVPFRQPADPDYHVPTGRPGTPAPTAPSAEWFEKVTAALDAHGVSADWLPDVLKELRPPPSGAEPVLREFIAFLKELLEHKRHAYEQLYAEAREEIKALQTDNDRLRKTDRKLRVALAQAAEAVREHVGDKQAAPWFILSQED